MNNSDLATQKILVEMFKTLEKEMEINNSETNKLGWQQRNQLITHVNSGYNNHNKLNAKRNKWNNAVEKGNILKWIYNLFVERREVYGYFKNYQQIKTNLNNLKSAAIDKEEYEIASYINQWLIQLP